MFENLRMAPKETVNSTRKGKTLFLSCAIVYDVFKKADEFMCGVIAVMAPPETSSWAAYDVYQGLLKLQHRGQDAAGILAYDFSRQRFSQKKDLGLVSQVFPEETLQDLEGTMAVGHTRYATVGSDDKRDLQPFLMESPWGGIGLAHNGNLINYHSLAAKMTKEWEGPPLTSNNDLEVILNLWGHYLQEEESAATAMATATATTTASPRPAATSFDFSLATRAAKKVARDVVGGYAVVGMVAGEGVIAFRDPKGIRPLALGRRPSPSPSYCLCSETTAMAFLGYQYLRDVRPGEFLFIDRQGQIHSANLGPQGPAAPCMFEWIYFAAAEGEIQERSVYTSRWKTGERLALKVKKAIKEEGLTPDIVAPLPDTSRTAAISLAEALGLPYREVLIKNRYIQRSFILNTQKKRERAVELKLSPIISEIQKKNILLVDDSIVRGTTSRKIISLLKQHGAGEITVAVAAPPIRHPCYYGIDFPVASELIAAGKSVEQIAREIGVEKVIYLEGEDLKKAIGLENMCMACVDNHYPTSIEEGELFASHRRKKDKKESLPLPPILHQGSVKEVRGVRGARGIRGMEGASPYYYFKFLDHYSVFDWGPMPDEIPGKGAAQAQMAHLLFHYLEREKGIRHTGRGLVGENVMAVEPVEIIRPKWKNGYWNYGSSTGIGTGTDLAPRLLPLEVLFRFGTPRGSSLLKRAQDTHYIRSLGLHAPPREGERFPCAIVEFSTKWEETDRHLTYEEAAQMASLSPQEFEQLLTLTRDLAWALKDLFTSVNIELWDGKFEFAFRRKEGKGTFLLADSLGLDELRLNFDGHTLSKEGIRQFYRKTDWYQAVERAKEKGRERGERDWKRICVEELGQTPPPLPPNLKELFSMMYPSVANVLSKAIEGKEVFPQAWSLEKLKAHF